MAVLLDDVDRAARQPDEPRWGRLLWLLLVDVDRAARRPHEHRSAYQRPRGNHLPEQSLLHMTCDPFKNRVWYLVLSTL